MGELLDAPAEIVAGELMDDPLPPHQLELQRAVDPQLLSGDDYDTGRMSGDFALTDGTGELFDELADDSEDD
jgi:hypothetical protein